MRSIVILGLLAVPLFAVACASPADGDSASQDDTAAATTSAHLIATKLVAGNNNTCALTADGSVRCWGSNTFGESGYRMQHGGDGTWGAIPVATFNGKLTDLALGNNTSCGLNWGQGVGEAVLAPPGAFTPKPFSPANASVGIYCWGADNLPMLGASVAGANPDGDAQLLSIDGIQRTASGGITPAINVMAMGPNGDFYVSKLDGVETMLGLTHGQIAFPAGVTITKMAIGSAHRCMASDSRLFCWGQNEHGQVGNGTTVTADAPVEITGLDGPIVSLAVGTWTSCAATTKSVSCWGLGSTGSLGNGATTFAQTTPAHVTGLGAVDKIVGGDAHFCALAGKKVSCWGYSLAGTDAIGTGAANPQLTPLAVQGIDGDVTDIAAGLEHTCAATPSGVQCWGANDEGQLGGASRDIAHSAKPLFVLATPIAAAK